MRSGLFLQKTSFYSVMPGSLRLPGITFLQSSDDADALLDDGLEVQFLVRKDDVAVASGGKAAVVVIHADALGGGLAGGADSAFQRHVHFQHSTLHAVVQAGVAACNPGARSG